MTLETTRFGNIECQDDDVLTVIDGVLGFPECTRFLVISHGEGSSFRWLQSVDNPELAFLVIDPAEFKADYAPEMPDRLAGKLGLDENTPRIVYTIVSIPAGQPEQMTANLAGPIVINAEARVAAQVVLDDPQWNTRHRILDEMRAVVEITDAA